MKPTRYCPTCLQEIPVNLLKSRWECMECGTPCCEPEQPKESRVFDRFLTGFAVACVIAAVVVGWWAV